MGHYASEMMGAYDGPTAKQMAKEKAEKLESDWDWGKQLLAQNHIPDYNVKSYTCPGCYARVKYWFLGEHDLWHYNLDLFIRQSARQAALDNSY